MCARLLPGPFKPQTHSLPVRRCANDAGRAEDGLHYDDLHLIRKFSFSQQPETDE